MEKHCWDCKIQSVCSINIAILGVASSASSVGIDVKHLRNEAAKYCTLFSAIKSEEDDEDMYIIPDGNGCPKCGDHDIRHMAFSDDGEILTCLICHFSFVSDRKKTKCPDCDEVDASRLVWHSDDITMECLTCGATYHPYVRKCDYCDDSPDEYNLSFNYDGTRAPCIHCGRVFDYEPINLEG